MFNSSIFHFVIVSKSRYGSNLIILRLLKINGVQLVLLALLLILTPATFVMVQMLEETNGMFFFVVLTTTESVNVLGGGTSFAMNVYQQWCDEYTQTRSENVFVDYNATDSEVCRLSTDLIFEARYHRLGRWEYHLVWC